MAAFLARVPSTPPPLPPPPSPAAPASQPSPKRTARRAIVQNASFVAPVGIPDTIPADEFGAPDDGFAVGGVEGGVPGGVVGGIVGGLAETPPAKASEPARLDFRASEAKPSVRVEPVYPDLAREARVQGVVILEVLVDRTGAPEAINVLRSEALLEQAAVDAVGEWRWNPYEVAGRPAPFWVTVTVTFRLT
jgi:protein TonB